MIQVHTRIRRILTEAHIHIPAEIPAHIRCIHSCISSLIFVFAFACFFYCSCINPAWARAAAQEKQSQTIEKQSQAIQTFEAFGKVSFTNGKQGGHASFEWQQFSSDRYSILLVGALGIAAVRINHTGDEVRLSTSRGEKYVAKSSEQLIKKTLGWDIPVTPLIYWLRGIPAPGKKPSRAMLDHQDHLVLLEQQGWKITYQSYFRVSGVDLPHKLILEHGPIRVKFIFKKWILG